MLESGSTRADDSIDDDAVESSDAGILGESGDNGVEEDDDVDPLTRSSPNVFFDLT